MSFHFSDEESDELELTGDAQDITRFAADGEAGDDHEFDLSHGDSSSDAPSVNGILGEYLLLEPIGQGGMGQVFRAEHRTMNRQVALKILSKEIAGRPHLLEQFFAEIRAVAKLMHPHIVTAFDAGSMGETHFLVMELVEGEVLSSRIRNQGRLSTAEAVSVLVQSARALAYAHKQGIIHRDIKPSNMMLTGEGVLKILDFGLAQLGQEGGATHSAKMLIGTPEYMSPEQIENPEQVDARSDLYSLGATLFYLLTGKSMFSGEPMQVARAQLYHKPAPLFSVRGDVDLRLDAVFSKLVAKNPDERYSSAAELLDSLEALNLLTESSSGSALRKGAYRFASESPTSVAFDKSTLARKSQIVAIDLGLTASTAAYFDPELGPQIVPVGEGNARHMRNMLWSRDGQVKVGPEAVAMRHAEPDNMFHSPQRWFGLQQISKPFGGRKVPPEVLVAAVLKQVVRYTSRVADGSSNAVVTVPSCYDQMHRRAIRNACRIAGIELMQLLDKPLAAGLSWLDLNHRLAGTNTSGRSFAARLLVVHLGGSGLEAGVVQAQDMTARQLGVCGHWKLGTQRWQSLLTEYFAAELKRETGKSIREDVSAATRLQRTIEIALERLANSQKVDVRFDWHDSTIQQTVTQAGFVRIASELGSAIRQVIVKALAIAETAADEIDHVLLAGPIMHMKPVQEIVRKLMPRKAGLTKIEKTEFARGAAIQARHLSSLSTKDPITPKAVGCTAYDVALLAGSSQNGKITPRVLMEKGTAIPAASAKKVLARPSGSQETQPCLQLVESSSLGESNWLKLGTVKPSDLFPLRPVDDPLQLKLEMDENGILESSLVWLAENRQARIPASSDPEMTDDGIQSLRHWLDTLWLCSDS